MHEQSKVDPRCRRCGRNAFAQGATYVHMAIWRDGDERTESVVYLCGRCSRSFETEEAREAYVRANLVV